MATLSAGVSVAYVEREFDAEFLRSGTLLACVPKNRHLPAGWHRQTDTVI